MAITVTPPDEDLDPRVAKRARSVMRAELRDNWDLYLDGLDLNWTALAEAAAGVLEAYTDEVGYTIHEDIFDLAVTVGDAWLKANESSD